MALSFSKKIKYNLYLWYFGLTKVKLIYFCRPKIIDLTNKKVIVSMPLNRRTRNHVSSMYMGAMIVGVDLVVGITAQLTIKKLKRDIIFIFKDLKADFIKRAEGDVHFVCNHGIAISNAVSQVAKSDNRVNIEVPVVAFVPDKFGNEPVANFSITLSMKEK